MHSIVVIDLDGTFVTVNTFHKWMRFALLVSLKKRRFEHTFRILLAVFKRALRSFSHRQMKQAILSSCESFITPQEIEYFVETLAPYVNQHLKKVVATEPHTTILATAAPALYAEVLSRQYGFDFCIATGSPSEPDWEENLREKKHDNLFALLNKHRLPHRIERLYTDHHDDLPLMERADTVILVNPSEETLERVSRHAISFQRMQV